MDTKQTLLASRDLVSVSYRLSMGGSDELLRWGVEAVEILADHFIPLTDRKQEVLQQLSSQFPIVVHCLKLSLGSVSRPDPEYVTAVGRVARASGAAILSDHLSASMSAKYNIGHLCPVFRRQATIDCISDNIRMVQDEVQLPMALETITEPIQLPGHEMSWPDFIRRVCEATEAQLVLDVSNLMVNAVNGLGPPATEAIDSVAGVPWAMIHIAGSRRDASGFLHDSHDCSPWRESYDLLEYALERQAPSMIICERDGELPLGEVASDVAEITAIVRRVRAAT